MWRNLLISAGKKIRLNHEITAYKVRLIDEDGSQIGIVTKQEALKQASEANLDLVEISPNTDPPVCRIMDYGKFLFKQNKEKAAARKKSKQIEVKEIKYRPMIAEGDYQVKLRNLLRFLDDGDKVKVSLRFRGREMSHQEFGYNILKRIEEDTAEKGIVEQRAKMEGRQLVMVIAPKKSKN